MNKVDELEDFILHNTTTMKHMDLVKKKMKKQMKKGKFNPKEIKKSFMNIAKEGAMLSTEDFTKRNIENTADTMYDDCYAEVKDMMNESTDKSIFESIESDELELFITNNANLYRQIITPTIKNFVRKIKQGNFDPKKALKQWMNVAKEGGKRYVKEFDAPGTKPSSVFSKSDYEMVAKELMDHYQDEIDYMLEEKHFSDSEKFKQSLKTRINMRTRQAVRDTSFISNELFESKNKPPKEFQQFIAIAKKSKDANDFVNKAREIKNVPFSVSVWFEKNYDPDEKGMMTAVRNLMKEVKGK